MPASCLNKLGKLGFGVAGPLGSRLFPENQTCSLIEQAINLGVSYFDTGPSYGRGTAETRLGKVLEKYPQKQLFISTKAGVDENGQRNFDPAHIRDSLNRSLDRLGLDGVDGLFLHGPAKSDLTDELFNVLADLKQQRMFTCLGMAGRGSELDYAIGLGQFELIMLPMGPNTKRDNKLHADKARASGAKVIGIEMLYHTRAPWRVSIQPGDLWHMARRIRRGGGIVSSSEPKIVLKTALSDPSIDVVLTSSSKQKHVAEWQSCLDELGVTS